ncbi:uncharacterized protein JCM15063_004187 [Sporobolomyces koalae]|uniref:uncharacterized protein n=1 Tax=Sporobolomyces koalae TaxID=500713 RepID=UPI003179C4E8
MSAYSPTASASQSLPSLSASSSSTTFAVVPPANSLSGASSVSSTGTPNRSTTSTPISQARPASTALARGASSAFDFLFAPAGAPSPAPLPTPPTNPETTDATTIASKLDKGKAVARSDEDLGAADSDAMVRQARVDKILKRAEASKLARAFRNRLALASFKTSRGWQDVNMDVIEPHLREEALKRSTPDLRATTPSRAPAPQQPLPTPPTPQPIANGADDLPFQYQINYSSRPFGMEAVIAGSGGGSAHKRTRSIEPNRDSGSPYGNNPQVSPYATAGVYRSGQMQGSPSDARLAKRRNMEGGTPRQRQKSAGGSKRGTPLRQSVKGTPAKPPSSSDSAFSSFVDAAAALTGMARAPSDPSGSGSEEEQYTEPGFERRSSSANGRPGSHLGASLPHVTRIHSIPHPPHHHHAFPQAHSLTSSHPFPGPSVNGHPTNSYHYDPLPLSTADEPASISRPATPDKTKTPGAAGSGDNSEVAAADLMLFLAHSPSPVQQRRTQPTLGDGSGMKGRRLFSAGGPLEGEDEEGATASGHGLAQSVFGGAIDGFSPSQAPSLARTSSISSPFITSSGPSTTRALDAPFDPAASTSSTSTALSVGADPAKPSSNYLSTSLAAAAPLSGLDATTASSDAQATFAGPPGTPRQRQPSFNGQGWESFINASPSPTRSTVPRGDTPPGIGGTGGETATVA